MEDEVTEARGFLWWKNDMGHPKSNLKLRFLHRIEYRILLKIGSGSNRISNRILKLGVDRIESRIES